MRTSVRHTVTLVAGLITCLLTGAHAFAADETPDARQLVQSAMDHWRGQTSYSEMTMTIHRPDWERSMTMEAWSRGDKQSLVRVAAPKKDLGNATLLDNGSMWTYSPKVNRVI